MTSKEFNDYMDKQFEILRNELCPQPKKETEMVPAKKTTKNAQATKSSTKKTLAKKETKKTTTKK